MWLFWLIVIVAVVLYLLKKSDTSPDTSTASSPNLKITISSHSGSDEQETKVGFLPTSDGGFQIGPSLPLPLTLYGLDQNDAAKLVSALEQGQEYEIREWFNHLVAQKNILCKELADWLAYAKPTIKRLVDMKRLASSEWETATDLDKEDLLAEFQNAAVEELALRPGYIETATTLLFEEPHDLTVDDALLARFKDTPDTYRSLLYAISAGSKVQVSPAADYRRKTFEELTDKGFMRRGQEIPLEDILAGMTMKHMQEIAGADAPKKFTRKVQAVEFLKALPDTRQRLEKTISFRELFQLKPIEGIDLEELAKAHAYSSEVSRVILRTLGAGLESQRLKESSKDWEADGWELNSEECCPDCRKLHGKTWKRFPQKLPPFHIGCDASIEMQ
ncbi:MAG: hypothetical protein GZ085_10710 [Sulfuriferula multivorans]|uniref:Uncharacterized protein n=1 Tax=Sulfuriferula multivorans TaxID=1559896 RepID=A0A7C9P8Q4_9PROT|nr:hypothetical protein [Sulfuriferula multivorans]